MIAALGVFGMASCATAPSSHEGRQDLKAQADQTLNQMYRKNLTLQNVVATSAGYAVFPNIGKGGFIVGGAYGKGVLYEHGQVTGFVSMSQGSVGAQAGAQSYQQLVVFQNPWDVQNLKSGTFKLGANASAVVLTAGAGVASSFRNGVAVFVVPKGGVMAELSLSGQKINFEPIGT